MAMMASMSAGWPAMWTGMMARVRGVIAASTACRIEVEGLQVNVREDRDGVGLDHRGGGGQEGVRRDDDLLLRANAGGHQRDAQRDRAVDDRDAVFAAVHGGEPALELSDLLAVQLAPLAAAQRAQQPLFLRLAEHRPGGEGTGADRRPPRMARDCDMVLASLLLWLAARLNSLLLSWV